MDIKGIDVIEIMLDLAVGPLELGDVMIEKLQMEHESQGLRHPFPGIQDIDKGLVYLLIPSKTIMDKFQILPDQLLYLHIELHPLLLGILEKLHVP